MPYLFARLLSWLSGGQKDASRELVARIVDAHTTLVGLDDLSPGEVTNRTLGDLVALCCESHDSTTVRKVRNPVGHMSG